MNYDESIAISLWREPGIGFDAGAHARSPTGEWTHCWELPNFAGAEMSLDDAFSVLVDGGYAHHALALVLTHSQLRTREHAHLPLAHALERATQGSITRLPSGYGGLWPSVLETVAKTPTASHVSLAKPAGLEFIRTGPLALLALLGKLESVFAGAGLDPILTGSFAAFLQMPYRLSPDLDFCLPPDSDRRNVQALAQALDHAGCKIDIVRERYIGGHFDLGAVSVSVDVEIGTAYRLPLAAEVFTQPLRRISNRRVMSLAMLGALKRRAGRLKDLLDVQYLP